VDSAYFILTVSVLL